MSITNESRARAVWRDILVSFALLAAAAGLAVSGVPALRTLASLLLVVSFAAATRFVLTVSSWRWFRLAVTVGAGVMAATLGTGGVIAGVALTAAELTLRSYRSWRLLSPRRRAIGFGLGVLAIAALVLARAAAGEAQDGLLKSLSDLGRWSVGSLAFFWAWSLFHLAVRMQLHFLRLRPKLAVSAFLIGFVPLLLLGFLAAMILYTGLGGARASRASATLESWRATTAAGSDLAPAVFDSAFTWPDRPARHRRDGVVRIPPPPWVADLDRRLVAELAADAGDSLAAPAARDTTTWFLADGRIWLMRWQGLGGASSGADAWLLGDHALGELSRQLKAGLVLNPAGVQQDDEDLTITAPSASDRAAFPGRRAMYRDVAGDPTFWADWRYFGGTLLDVVRLDPDGVSARTIFLTLRVGWSDLRAEFLEGDNNLNVAVVIALGLVAFLFLVIEVFALFFGIRISEGIVSAVRALQKGTQTVAAGDLDAAITIPNEDEFGDLAASFNEMTVAVKQGREDALANERLTRELETAREIQERLLPHEEPHLKGFEITGTSIPSREIGGDYFDFLLQPDERIGVAIGDVSGKGMPAALLMSNLQASLHGQVIHPSTVAEVVGRVNGLLVGSTDAHMFATFFYGLLDTRQGTLTSTNAGHNPPLVLRADGTLDELTSGGLLLGMLPDQEYRQETIDLAPGEVVVLYTDGITEAVGPSSDEDDPEAMFGEEALREVLIGHGHLPAVGIKEAILAAVADHTAGVAQSDDITLVVIRRQG